MDSRRRVDLYDRVDHLLSFVQALVNLGADSRSQLLTGEDVAWLLSPMEGDLRQIRELLLDTPSEAEVA